MLAHIPLAPAFGAEVMDLDLARVTPERFHALYSLWKKHHVLLLRGQRLDDIAWKRFVGMFGELEPAAAPHGGSADAEWHAAGSHLQRPPLAMLAHAGQARADSAIWFANLAVALRSLPPELVTRLRRFTIHHAAPGAPRSSANDDPTRTPAAQHPLVIVHPETGEQAVYLGRRRQSWFAGLPLDESERLLNIMWSYATAPAVTWRHAWRAGDVLLWNNLTTMHRLETAAGAAGLLRAQVEGRYTLSAPIQQEAA
jgi:taurine dioxygenase